EVARREFRHLCRQLDGPRVRVRPGRVVGQLPHLLERRLPHLLAEPVADVHREEPGERVQVAVAGRVLEAAAVAAHDDRPLLLRVAPHPREMHPQVLSGAVLQLLVGQACRRGGHAAVPFLARAIWITTLTSMIETATAKIAVPMTLICGGVATRAAPQTKSG